MTWGCVNRAPRAMLSSPLWWLSIFLTRALFTSARLAGLAWRMVFVGVINQMRLLTPVVRES